MKNLSAKKEAPGEVRPISRRPGEGRGEVAGRRLQFVPMARRGPIRRARPDVSPQCLFQFDRAHNLEVGCFAELHVRRRWRAQREGVLRHNVPQALP